MSLSPPRTRLVDMRIISLFTIAVFSFATPAKDKKPPAPPAPPPCAAKVKSKISQIEKKTADYAKKVAAYKAKHKDLQPSGGRMPASFCGDSKNGMTKAALLAKEGIPLAEELEVIEGANSACAGVARAARLKIDELFMGLNTSYIQTCTAPPF